MFKHKQFVLVFLSLSIIFFSTAILAGSSTDTDGDGLSDGDEFMWGTDPGNPDTDSDGLSDGDEVYVYHTLPTDEDTDREGLKDGIEVMFYGTDPLKQSTDGDMYDDRQEIFGTSMNGDSMPGYVLSPGDNVFVASYPIIDIDILEQVSVTEIVEIYTEFREINMSEVSYAVSNTDGVSMSAGTSKAHKKSEWIDVGNEEEDLTQQNAYREDIRSTEEKSWKGYNFGTKVIGEVGEETWVKGGGEVGMVGPVPTAKASVEAGHKIYSNVKGIVEAGHDGKDYKGESITKKTSGETEKKHITKTYKKSGSGQESSFSTTVTRTSYHETTVTNANSIATGQEWATATTVDPSNAAKLRFTFYLKNIGTDIAKEVEDLRFNIFIGDSEIPITYPSLTDVGISLSNLEPGERVQFAGEVTITLDELKAIDMGFPIRLMIAYYSYGEDELFYESAWGEDVLVEIDDDPLGIQKTTKNFMTYTAYDENYIDVLKRLNTTVRIRNQGTRTEVPLELFNDTIASILGLPVTEWSWWTGYLQKPTEATKFSEESSEGKTRLLLVFNKDSDHDYYTDRIETQLGSDINDVESHPSPLLVAGYYREIQGENTTVQLKFTNSGDFDAYGIEARMYSPDDSTIIHDGLIGGSGRIEAGRTFVIPNETFIYMNATDNFTMPVIIVYYNDPQGHHSFIVHNDISDLNETLPDYSEELVHEPHFTLQANDEYTYSEQNFLIVDYENPDELITNATIFVAFQNMSGHVTHYENTTIDLEQGNNSFVFWWNPSEDLPGDAVGEEYKVVVALTDYQNIMLYDDIKKFEITEYVKYPKLVDKFSDGDLEAEFVFGQPEGNCNVTYNNTSQTWTKEISSNLTCSPSSSFITILSPECRTYTYENLWMNWTAQEEEIQWIGYSLNGEENVTCFHDDFNDSETIATLTIGGDSSENAWIRIPKTVEVTHAEADIHVSGDFNNPRIEMYSAGSFVDEFFNSNVNANSIYVWQNEEIGGLPYNRWFFYVTNNNGFYVQYHVQVYGHEFGANDRWAKADLWVSPYSTLKWSTGLSSIDDYTQSAGPIEVKMDGVDLVISTINNYLSGCIPENGMCDVPLEIYSDHDSNTEIMNLDVQWCPNDMKITGLEGQNNLTVWAEDTTGTLRSSTVYFTIDLTPPQYSDFGSDTTYDTVSCTSQVSFYTRWNDELSTTEEALFSWNVSGVWVNESIEVFGDGWSNITKEIPCDIIGKEIGFKFYARDNVGNMNYTSEKFILVIPPFKSTYFKIPKNAILLSASLFLSGYDFSGTYPKDLSLYLNTDELWRLDGELHEYYALYSDASEDLMNPLILANCVIHDYLSTCVPDDENLCEVPLNLETETSGIVKLWNLRVLYEMSNEAPIIISRNPENSEINISEGENINFTVESVDPEGHDITISWYVDGAYTGVDGEGYSYLANFNSAGTHEIIASVSDGVLTTNQTWLVNVADFYTAAVIINPNLTFSGIGDDITFNIDIDTTAEIYGIQFEMKFNQSILKAVAINEGGFLSNDGASTFTITDVDNKTGWLLFMATRRTVEHGVNGSGNIASITFGTENEGSDELFLDNLEVSELFEGQIYPVPIKSSSQAEVTIFRLVGDINGDCKVSIIDLATVGWAYGSRPGDDNWIPSADTYPDGVINLFDLATVGLHYGDIC